MMRVSTVYIIIVCILIFAMFLVVYGLYEDNFLNDWKVYNGIVIKKYINYNTDGDAYVLKLKFKWDEDSIIESGALSKKNYNIYKISDTTSNYYIPSASADKIVFVNTLKNSNKHSLIAILFILIFIFYLLCKLKTIDKNEYIELG